jgi:hypothetical protein
MNKKLLVVGGVVAVVALVVSLVSFGGQSNGPERLGKSTQYKDSDLGFQFLYPEDWTPRGKTFFSSPRFETIAIVSAKSDTCPQGDGPGISIGQGYVVRGEKYISSWCGEASEQFTRRDTEENFEVIEAINTDVIVWTAECPFSDCQSKYIQASFNLPDLEYPGVGLYAIWEPELLINKETSPTPNPSTFQEALEEFKSVLRTIELTK